MIGAGGLWARQAAVVARAGLGSVRSAGGRAGGGGGGGAPAADTWARVSKAALEGVGGGAGDDRVGVGVEEALAEARLVAPAALADLARGGVAVDVVDEDDRCSLQHPPSWVCMHRLHPPAKRALHIQWARDRHCGGMGEHEALSPLRR